MVFNNCYRDYAHVNAGQLARDLRLRRQAALLDYSISKS